MSETSPFDTPEALALNKARLDHLDSLGLSLVNRTVLDLGCGRGRLIPFFHERGCHVTALDGRSENVEYVKTEWLAHKVDGRLADLDSPFWSQHYRAGRFEVVLCYGLLYHLQNPLAALKAFAHVCSDLLLLETIVLDHWRLMLEYDPENASNPNQSISGLGCRPTPSLVVKALQLAGFEHVYVCKSQPKHEDFRWTILNDMEWKRNGHYLRQVFVGSRHKLDPEQFG